MAEVHPAGSLFGDDASLEISFEHVGAADTDALVLVEVLIWLDSPALDGSDHGRQAVRAAPEHAFAEYHVIVWIAMDDASTSAMACDYQHVIAARRKSSLHEVVDGAACAATCRAGDDAAADLETPRQAESGAVASKVLIRAQFPAKVKTLMETARVAFPDWGLVTRILREELLEEARAVANWQD